MALTKQAKQVLADCDLDAIKGRLKNPFCLRQIEVLQAFQRGESASSIALRINMSLSEVKQIAYRLNQSGLDTFLKDEQFNLLDSPDLLSRLFDTEKEFLAQGNFELPLTRILQVMGSYHQINSYNTSKVRNLLHEAGLKRVLMTQEEYQRFLKMRS